MEQFAYIDIFATKGIEYLIAIGFLLTLIAFWRFLNVSKLKPISDAVLEGIRRLSELIEGFLVPDGFYFHPGHTWAKVDGNDLVTIGMDDFAQKMVGEVSAIELPPVGSFLRQGDRGWKLNVDSKYIEMLSPVDGEVVSVNQGIKNSPDSVNKDSYGEGWLIKVRAPNLKINLKNLLYGNLAKKWITDASESLRLRINHDAGLVYQDGGLPVKGIAKNLNPDKWDEIAKEFFLTKE